MELGGKATTPHICIDSVLKRNENASKMAIHISVSGGNNHKVHNNHNQPFAAATAASTTMIILTN